MEDLKGILLDLKINIGRLEGNRIKKLEDNILEYLKINIGRLKGNRIKKLEDNILEYLKIIIRRLEGNRIKKLEDNIKSIVAFIMCYTRTICDFKYYYQIIIAILKVYL